MRTRDESSSEAAYNPVMIRSLGKAMQVTGLVILPIAVLMQLTGGVRAPTGSFSVSAMLILMVAGVALFLVGRLVEGYGGS
jgi:hypothetical protein